MSVGILWFNRVWSQTANTCYSAESRERVEGHRCHQSHIRVLITAIHLCKIHARISREAAVELTLDRSLARIQKNAKFWHS
jgi:hypothetical protein